MDNINITIIVDSREKENKHILKYFDNLKIPYVVKTLKKGDYGVEVDGKLMDVVIERKNSLSEITQNFTAHRDRFKREFEKNSGGRTILLIENNSYEDVINGKYRSEMNPKALLGSLLSWQFKYNLNISFMPNNRYSGNFIYWNLYYFVRNELNGK